MDRVQYENPCIARTSVKFSGEDTVKTKSSVGIVVIVVFDVNRLGLPGATEDMAMRISGGSTGATVVGWITKLSAETCEHGNQNIREIDKRSCFHGHFQPTQFMPRLTVQLQRNEKSPCASSIC